MSKWKDWDEFRESSPRAARGGIRAQTQGGDFGETWWTKKWIAVLESFDLGSRLSKGRLYARSGQVLSISVDPGEVLATVQGSRLSPYQVRIKVKEIRAADWSKVAQTIASQAIFSAKLLAGEMPRTIESAFQLAGVSLFPEHGGDVETSCTCPDESNPCKHIAAVYYLLGEEFDRDPFLILTLRGMSRHELMGLLSDSATSAPSEEQETIKTEPLPTCPAEFWNGGALPEHLLEGSRASPGGAGLPRRLGKMPFWRGRDNFLDSLDAIYAAAAAKAAQVLGDA